MTDYRWQGYSHEELYSLIHTGPGAAASTAPIGFAGAAIESIKKIDSQLQTAISQLGEGWTGSAADRATSALAPLTGWTDHTTAGLATIEDIHQQQADTVTQLRAAMPPPVEGLTESPSFGSIMIAPVYPAPVLHWAEQDAAQSDASTHAVDLMSRYDQYSQNQRGRLSQLDEPPAVVVDGGTAAPPSGASAATGGWLAVPHSPHAASDSTPATAAGGNSAQPVGVVPQVGANAIAVDGRPGSQMPAAPGPTDAAVGAPAQGQAGLGPGGIGAGGIGAGGIGAGGLVGAGIAAPGLRPSSPGDETVIGRPGGEPLPKAPGGPRWTPGPPGQPGGRPSGPAIPAGELVEPAVPPRSIAARTGGTGSGSGTSMMPPFMGGAANRAHEREHRRPDYLLEPEDVFAVDRLVVPPVIGG